MNQTDFGSKIGVKQTTVAGWENGARIPSDSAVISICREFNVNEDWLRTGEGEMFIKMTRDEEIATFIGKALHSEEDSFKKRLISALSALNESDWETLEKLALSLVDKEKEQD